MLTTRRRFASMRRFLPSCAFSSPARMMRKQLASASRLVSASFSDFGDLAAAPHGCPRPARRASSTFRRRRRTAAAAARPSSVRNLAPILRICGCRRAGAAFAAQDHVVLLLHEAFGRLSFSTIEVMWRRPISNSSSALAIRRLSGPNRRSACWAERGCWRRCRTASSASRRSSTALRRLLELLEDLRLPVPSGSARRSPRRSLPRLPRRATRARRSHPP